MQEGKNKFILPKEILLPCDVNPTTDKLIDNYYHYYYDIVKEKNIQSVLEIGVRAGYSAYAMLSANPQLDYCGIDLNQGTHGGIKGAIDHARKILRDAFTDESHYPCILEENSSTFPVRGMFDLIHIDGDHSYNGCKADLVKFVPHAKYVLIDDYDYIGQVRRAVDEFLEEHPEIKYEYIPSHRGHILMMVEF